MKVKRIITLATATLMMAFALAVPATIVANESTVYAVPSSVTQGINDTKPAGAKTDLPALLKQVTNILLFIIGAISVIMVIVGGLRYVTSAGDSNSVNGAKNTILYAVVGLVVAAIAYAIVNFVVTKF
jgi:hypothetical protein